ncbi:MAG: hypothetical protein A2X78_01610 [Gammaproteobacteria bacterium GWE2_37_16]|nr:MAG: hypothetical protein A2X78_01610 [Gammaproteobacteria bacterium GWE2_37_16]
MNPKLINVLNQWHTFFIFFAVFVGVLIASLVAYWLLKRIIFLAGKKKTKVSLFRKDWQKSLLVITVLILLYSAEYFFSMPKVYADYYSHLLTLLVIISLTWFSIQTLYAVREYICKRAEKPYANSLNARATRTKLNILFKIAVFAVGIIGGATALMTFPKVQQLGISILASAGVAGLLIGFAAQKSLGNLLAGIQIALTQPIRMDDVVIVEGNWGNVEEITLTYVVVRIWDGQRLIVPITYFVEKIFQNWTRTSFELIGTVFIQVDYTASLKEIRSALDSILVGTDLWDGRVKSLAVTNANAQNIELRVLVSAGDPSKLWDIRCYVREQLITFLQENHPDYLPRTRVALENQ